MIVTGIQRRRADELTPARAPSPTRRTTPRRRSRTSCPSPRRHRTSTEIARRYAVTAGPSTGFERRAARTICTPTVPARSAIADERRTERRPRPVRRDHETDRVRDVRQQERDQTRERTACRRRAGTRRRPASSTSATTNHARRRRIDRIERERHPDEGDQRERLAPHLDRPVVGPPAPPVRASRDRRTPRHREAPPVHRRARHPAPIAPTVEP